jgi:hypothetical protein
MLNPRMLATFLRGISILRKTKTSINEGIQMTTNFRAVCYAAVASLVCMSAPAFADDHPYSEGPIVNIASIRTVDGKYEDYMHWLSTTWKQEQEASKKAGYITDYKILSVEPRGPDDPDLLLVITYKNWAAYDGSIAKGDAIAKQIEGSLEKANKATSDRAVIRRVLGSMTTQEMLLK